MKAAKVSYSTAYVAKRLGVSVPTVQRWVDSGRLKAWKTLGGHRRVDAESADELFRQQDEGVLQVESESLNIVIVDDNPDDRDLICAMLENITPGARISTAQNGYEGLLKIGELHPDLVITDIIMPTMDGFELIAQLIAHTSAKPMHILAVSSLSLEQVRARGPLANTVHLLTKPLEQERLTQALTTLGVIAAR